MAVMRDRLRLLGALLATVLLGLGSAPQASAQTTTKKKAKRKRKKKAAKKAGKKTAKKKATRVSEPGTAALLGAGLVAAGAAHKLGRRRQKKP